MIYNVSRIGRSKRRFRNAIAQIIRLISLGSLKCFVNSRLSCSVPRIWTLHPGSRYRDQMLIENQIQEEWVTFSCCINVADDLIRDRQLGQLFRTCSKTSVSSNPLMERKLYYQHCGWDWVCGWSGTTS